VSEVEVALAYFEQSFSCSQAVFAAFAPRWGLDRERALRVAAAFGGGMARKGYTCGAVTGALMAIGLYSGGTDPGEEEVKERTYALAQDFLHRFTMRNGSIVCSCLLGHDMGTPEGRDRAGEESLFSTRCPAIVRDAAEILQQMLED